MLKILGAKSSIFVLSFFIFGLSACSPEIRERHRENSELSFLFNNDEGVKYNKILIDQCMAVGDKVPEKVVARNYGREYVPLEVSCYSSGCITTGDYFRDDIRYEDANSKRAMSVFRSCMKSGGASDNDISFCALSDKGSGYCYAHSSKSNDWYVSRETGRIYRHNIGYVRLKIK